MPRSALSLDAVLRRDRLIVAIALVTLTMLAWAYLVHEARAMRGMDTPGAGMGGGSMSTGVALPQMRPWDPGEVLLLSVMWAVMMAAMMAPSATPMILLFARVNRQRVATGGPAVPTAVFLLAYLTVWTGFSVAAAVAQTGLHAVALLSPMMVSTSPMLGGVLLIAAGLYQVTPLKRACLVRCRSPLSFILGEWRDGPRGAFVMGVRHGVYCVGCCWAIMALLFVAGVMNLLWVAAIALFVLIEKVAPRGDLIGRAAAAVLVVIGMLLIVDGP